MKRSRILLLAPTLILAYLAMAALWAWVSFDAALASVPVPQLAPLSQRQSAILLRVEAPGFFGHYGLSIGTGQGLATISSAVARDVFLQRGQLDGVRGALQSMYQRVFACCKRIDLGRDVMALVIDARLTKHELLARYTASVYMGTHQGRQLRGLPQAAQAHLGKPLEAATEHEFVTLVAMIKAPNQFHPVRDPAALAQRSRRIEALLSGACKPDGWFDTDFDACDTTAPR
ncbi:transglycosylase domain-containing protein [Massilia sp. H6]|uniref:transglycosylase domain-containing protein n=1 Tax=Massilia sp. H6 TaxID=2970464 RepID=UPI002169E3C8|nr:transglycosylase domain-containing protein [Massilia sp. H6]UVW29141.1 transglycosylase domain-containing protein [Massilia sp. H6]